MAWGTLAAVALGAVFGIGSTLLTDAVRARRDVHQRWEETRRTVYVRFLVAATQAHSRMVISAFSGKAAEERRRAVHDAFHLDPQHSEAKSVLRELAITAPDPVYRQALRVYEQLRVLRELLAETQVAFGSAEYDAVNKPFFERLDTLQSTMRADLQPAGSLRRPGSGLLVPAEPATQE